MEEAEKHIIEECIEHLNNIDVNGENMQYILKKTMMEEQMLSQLIATFDKNTIDYYLQLYNKK
jgi:hypothetical protein